MNYPKSGLSLGHHYPAAGFAVLVVAHALLALPAFAQAQAAASEHTPKKEDVLVLSAFEVRAATVGRYQAAEATSGGRVAVSLMDSPSSLAVITSEMLSDVGADRLLDAVKYTSGVTEGITPNGLERVTIRGFQSDFTVIDGFRTNSGQMNITPGLIERVEVMKGPNAILQPQGTPGGTVNAVTKSPSFNPGGSLHLQTGLFNANQATLDYNGVLVPRKVAFRVLMSGNDSEGWWDETFTKSWAVMPSVLFQLGDVTRLTIKSVFSDYKVATYGGIPLDPSVGTNDELITFRGVDRRSNTRGEEEIRLDNREEISAFLTTKYGDHLSIRFAGRFLNLYTDAFGTNPALTAGGAVNPLTGLWVGGTVFGPGPTYTPSPAPVVSPVGLRSGADTVTRLHFANFQNDYAFEYDLGGVRTTTTAGLAYAEQITNYLYQRTGTRGTVDITNTRASQDEPVVWSPINAYSDNATYEMQAYFQEQLGLWENRILVSGGLSSIWAKRDSRNRLTGVESNIPESQKTSINYGVVYKVTPAVSLYYGHSSNAALTGDSAGVAAGTVPLFAEGKQDEFGIKVMLANNRVMLTAAHFELNQTNFRVDNPLNYTSPPPVPRLPSLYFDRGGKGWEINVNAALNKQWTIVGNYYHMKNRDPNGIPFQASADDAGAVLVRYDFSDSVLPGLGLSIGADYLGRRPGIQASGFTAASLSTNLIPVQPSFYAPARTLVNGAIYYTRGDYRFQVNIDNILDKDYVTGTFTRNGIWVGTPINARFSVTYKF